MRPCLTFAAVCLVLLHGFSDAQGVGPGTAPAARPNLVLIVADDLCWRDTGFTGNKDVRTPNLDRLRSEGTLLRRMYSPASTCTPTRSALLTGLYGVRSGAYPNHSDVRPGTRSLFTYLKEAGYRVALQNKADVRPAESFPFEAIEGQDDFTAARAFITRAPADQPWLYYFGSDDPHSPWTRGPPDYDPAKLVVPPYYHDNAVTRQKLVNYYGEVTSLDGQVGKILAMLKETGHVDDTLVMFVSEQGSSLPYGGKWTLYDNGIHSAAVVRWPGHVPAGSSKDAITQYIDIPPTFLAAAGVDPTAIDTGCPDATGSKTFDGRSFLDVLDGKTDTLRDVAFAQHTAMGVFGTVGPFPVRTATDGHYQYIRCLTPDKTFSIDGWTKSQVLKSWEADSASDPALAKRVDQLYHPPAEALYDLATDPYELTNVIDDRKLAAVKADLSKKLDAWMAQQGDKGLATEMDFKVHMRTGRGKETD